MDAYWRGILARSMAIVGLVGVGACTPPPEAAPGPRPVLVEQPRQADTEIRVFSGEVRARQQPVLAFRIGGKIAQRHAEAGMRVRRGQLLAQLDPDDLRLQAQAAQAQLRAAQAQAALARSEYQRHARMLERKLISPALFEAKQAALDASQAQVDQARAQHEVLRNQDRHAHLNAPEDGVIVARRAEAGQVVAAGQAVYELAVDGEREVRIDVPEQQLRLFAPGQPVQVELWSQPGRQWPGTVREIAAAADPGARTFEIRVQLQAAQAEVELGQSARVLLPGTAGALLSVPLGAVSAEAGEAFVYVIDPEGLRARRRAVQVHAWGRQRASIAQGLQAQDWVVIGGVHLIDETQPLRPVDRDNRPVHPLPAP